jgi:hypothetical protein
MVLLRKELELLERLKRLEHLGLVEPLEHLERWEHLRLVERLELLERSSALRSWRYLKNHALHSRRRISQHKNLPAQLVISDLSGDAGKFFAIDGYFHRRVFDHVLAPVLAFDFARRCVIAAVVINHA